MVALEIFRIEILIDIRQVINNPVAITSPMLIGAGREPLCYS